MNLENPDISERSQTQKSNILWLYLYEISRIGKSTDTEGRLMVTMPRRNRKWELLQFYFEVIKVF